MREKCSIIQSVCSFKKDVFCWTLLATLIINNLPQRCELSTSDEKMCGGECL